MFTEKASITSANHTTPISLNPQAMNYSISISLPPTDLC